MLFNLFESPLIANILMQISLLRVQDFFLRDWEVDLFHVYREANGAADFLASCGHA